MFLGDDKMYNFLRKLIIICFILFISFFSYGVNAKTDDKNFYCPLCTKSEDDPLYKKEKQFFKKVSLIKSVFGDSIDEVVLAYTVLHRYGQDYTYNTEYTKDFDENQYRNMWTNFKGDSSSLSISKEDAEKIEENEKLDLLSIAAIVMVDSNHNQKYSDACYKEALAGDSLVGNNNNSGLFVDLQNALFCGRFSVSDEEEPDSNSIFSKLFGTDSFLVNHIIKQNRMANVKSVCKNGYVGGLYSDVNKITDDKTKTLIKKRRAQEIIDFANYYKKLYGSKDEETNNCSVNISGSTGQFASWRQFDSEWKDISLGGVSSVGKAGCLVTSVSMQIARSGTKIGTLPSGYSEFNPGAFVTSLNEYGGFAGGGNYAWTGYSTIAPNWGMGDFIELDVSDNKSLADAISRELSSGFGSGNSQKFLVLQIHHSASSQHWVAVNGVENGQVTIFDPAKNGTTLDQNYNNWVVDGYKIMYASDVPFGQTGTTSNNTCTSDNGGAGNIKIPEQYGGGGYTVTTIDTINWAPGTGQSALVDEWKRKGSQYKDGIAVIDGRYLIACTSTFGNVGDKIDFYLNDGTKIPTIMMDEKSQQYVPWDQNPANKWGHDNGANVLEFEVAYSFYKAYGNPGNGYNSWYKEWAGKRVSSATNLGSGNISSDNNTSYTNNSTVTSSGVTGNDIARLAVDVAVTASPKERIKMSSPHERPTMKEAEAYLKIHDAIWPDLLKKNIGTQSPYYASCAPAVLKVLHYSGADTVITKYKAADQGPYFDSSPLWERVNVDDTSKTLAEVCQPGDVINQPLTDSSRRLYPHSMIYVGNKLVRERFPNSNGDTWESAEGRTLLPGITVRGNQKVGDWRIYRLVSKSGETGNKSFSCENGQEIESVGAKSFNSSNSKEIPESVWNTYAGAGEDPSISVIDEDGNIIADRKGDARREGASTTKVFAGYAAVKLLDVQNDYVVGSNWITNSVGASNHNPLNSGEKLTVLEAATYTFPDSSNSTAHAIAVAIGKKYYNTTSDDDAFKKGMNKINELIKDSGCNNTRLGNSSGLGYFPNGRMQFSENGGYPVEGNLDGMTANDLVLITMLAMKDSNFLDSFANYSMCKNSNCKTLSQDRSKNGLFFIKSGNGFKTHGIWGFNYNGKRYYMAILGDNISGDKYTHADNIYNWVINNAIN